MKTLTKLCFFVVDYADYFLFVLVGCVIGYSVAVSDVSTLLMDFQCPVEFRTLD